MSARTPDFYIGISTQNPPTIISIGQTINGMEEIEVRLDQPDEEKLNIFKGKIDKIVVPAEVPAAEVPAAEVPAAEVHAAEVPAAEVKTDQPPIPPNTDKEEYIGLASILPEGQFGTGKKTKRRRNKRRLTKRRKTKRSKK